MFCFIYEHFYEIFSYCLLLCSVNFHVFDILFMHTYYYLLNFLFTSFIFALLRNHMHACPAALLHTYTVGLNSTWLEGRAQNTHWWVGVCECMCICVRAAVEKRLRALKDMYYNFIYYIVCYSMQSSFCCFICNFLYFQFLLLLPYILSNKY